MNIILAVLCSLLLLACNQQQKKEQKSGTIEMHADTAGNAVSPNNTTIATLDKDSQLMQLSIEILAAIKEKNFSKLEPFIHPAFGIRFSPYAFIDTADHQHLSATQFRRSNVVGMISAALSETGLSPNRLELEITETLLLDDSKEVHSALRKLRSLGIRISLDDFGTGYSSLGYLRKFTVDKVKIDRSFVSGITKDADHLAIVQAVVGLTHALGMTSVAESADSGSLRSTRTTTAGSPLGSVLSPLLPTATPTTLERCIKSSCTAACA